MSAVLTVGNAVKMVEAAVEKIKNDADQHFPAAASIGDAVRQGDIYIQLIDDFVGVPQLYKKLERPQYPLQLAFGNTQGSRHMLEESEGAEVFVLDLDVNRALSTEDEVRYTDDSVKAFNDMMLDIAQQAESEAAEKSDSAAVAVLRRGMYMNLLTNMTTFSGPIFRLKNAATVSHPEHGNWILPPGAYRVTFQRTVDAESRIRRVLD